MKADFHAKRRLSVSLGVRCDMNGLNLYKTAKTEDGSRHLEYFSRPKGLLFPLLLVLSFFFENQSNAMLKQPSAVQDRFGADSERRYSFTYKDYKGIIAFLQEMKKKNPEIVHLHLAGNSTLGLPIFYASLSKPKEGFASDKREIKKVDQNKNLDQLPTKDDTEPSQFLLVGGHHGNEKPSVEAVLSFMRLALESRNRAWLKKVLEKTEIHLLPTINPDGYALSNRTQARGIDINRDYYYPGRRRLAFRAKETRVMQGLLKKLSISHAISLHSGLEGVLWPFGYTDKMPSGKIGSKLPSIAKEVADSIGV